MNELHKIRSNDNISKVDTSSAMFLENEAKLLAARNNFVAGTTFNYKYSYQLSVAVTKMQGLTKAIRVFDYSTQITVDW